MEVEIKSFESPDDRTDFPGGTVALVNLAGGTVGKAVFGPGWRWSTHVKSIVKTDWCRQTHIGYQISGRLHIVMENGEEFELGPGDVAIIPPGHDGWVVGDEPCASIDWTGMENYAKPVG